MAPDPPQRWALVDEAVDFYDEWANLHPDEGLPRLCEVPEGEVVRALARLMVRLGRWEQVTYRAPSVTITAGETVRVIGPGEVAVVAGTGVGERPTAVVCAGP